jgi:uncharacterized Ntn-hydrolase superfamily protein
MTFSVVARCKTSGMFGLAISSSSPAVAARCAFARAGVGAVASQNITDPSLGARALDLMQLGASSMQAIEVLKSSSEYMDYRQVLAVDNNGSTAIHSGSNSLGVFAEASGDNVVSAGNLLANNKVPDTIIDCFENTAGHLGERLIAALQAGLAAGGEAGPVHSAGLLVVDSVSWPVAELRCDWLEDACPIQNIASAWAVYQPQLEDYLQRAHNPTAAPSYGVPGDE